MNWLKENHLYPEFQKRVQKMLARLVRREVFFASMALSTEHRISSKLQFKAATTGTSIIWNPVKCEDLSDDELLGLCVHELMHDAMMHSYRRKDRNFKRWNIATDFVINAQLDKEGFVLPDGGLMDPQYENSSAEEAFRIIDWDKYDPPKPPPQQKGAQANAGSGQHQGTGESGGTGSSDSQSQGDQQTTDSGQSPDSNQAEQRNGSDQANQPNDDQSHQQPGDGRSKSDREHDQQSEQNGTGSEGDGNGAGENAGEDLECDWGVVLDADENRDASEVEAEINQQEVRVEEAIRVAMGAGTLSGNMLRLIKSEKDDIDKLDWKDILSRTILDNAGCDDYTWQMPNRRYLHQGVYLPQTRSEKIIEIVVGLDVSGSIDKDQLGAFADHLTTIIEDLPENVLAEITVLCCDTYVREEFKLTKADLPIKLQVRAGGGTNFRPVFDKVKQDRINPVALIYFTDMMCANFPADKPDYDVIWLSFAPEWLQRNYLPYQPDWVKGNIHYMEMSEEKKKYWESRRRYGY